MKYKLLTTLLAGTVACVSLAGCDTASTSQTQVDDFKLDTYVTITSYDNTSEEVLQNALNLCDKYEKIFSMHDESSELWSLNHNETQVVSDDLGIAINKGFEMYRASDGHFQISIGSVSGLWDFHGDNPYDTRFPDDELLKEKLKYVDDSKISLTKEGSGWRVNKPSETVIDLGAVAKGYIADGIKDYLVSEGCTSAVINLGGNVCCIGDKNGSPFNIGIRKPFGEANDTVAVFELNDMSLISSGISERYFKDYSERIYHHILDPETGYPYDNELYQVSIITKSSLDGDCLSTLCFTLGLEEGLKLIEETPDTEAVFITSDEELHFSSGAKNFLRK